MALKQMIGPSHVAGNSFFPEFGAQGTLDRPRTQRRAREVFAMRDELAEALAKWRGSSYDPSGAMTSDQAMSAVEFAEKLIAEGWSK